MVNSILFKVFPEIISVCPVCLTTGIGEFYEKLVKEYDKDLVEYMTISNKIEY